MRSCKAWNIGRLLWLSGINDAYSMSSLNVSFPPLDPSVPFGPLPLQTEEDSFYQPFLKPETFHFVFFFSGPFLLPSCHLCLEKWTWYAVSQVWMYWLVQDEVSVKETLYAEFPINFLMMINIFFHLSISQSFCVFLLCLTGPVS